MMASEFGSETAFLVVRVVANDGLPYVDKVEIVPDPNIIWPDRFYAVVYQKNAVTYEKAREEILQTISTLEMLKWARPWFEEDETQVGKPTTKNNLRTVIKSTERLMAALSQLASKTNGHIFLLHKTLDDTIDVIEKATNRGKRKTQKED